MTHIFCSDVRKVRTGLPDCCSSCHEDDYDMYPEMCSIEGDYERGCTGDVCCRISQELCDRPLTAAEWDAVLDGLH